MRTLTPPDNASEDQLRAVDQLTSWLNSDEQEMTLGGYAGTGKTTLIRSIVESLERQGLLVAVAALAGKAVSVLHGKGLHAAQTLHSLLYEPEGAPEEWTHAREAWRAAKKRMVREGLFDSVEEAEILAPALLDSSARDAWHEWRLMVEIYGENVSTEPTWVEVDSLDYDMVIVDEASMVSYELLESLRRHNVRLLFVGDHGQLEPVGENPGLMLDPQIRLETIHRQAAGSEILQFAHYVRQGGDPRRWEGPGSDVLVNPSRVRYADFDVVLCGFNDRRVHLNQVVRHERGIHGELPQRGETLICLQNKQNKSIFNGFICEALQVERGRDANIVRLEVRNTQGARVWVSSWLPQFGEPRGAPYVGRDISMFDWGYALTCHKAQGSEWDNVAVVEQISRSWTAERWRYTAATRAAKRLVYLT